MGEFLTLVVLNGHLKQMFKQMFELYFGNKSFFIFNIFSKEIKFRYAGENRLRQVFLHLYSFD